MNAQEMKAARKLFGYTQTQMGEALGYSWSQIRVFESGKKDPPKVVALAMRTLLADHANVTVQGQTQGFSIGSERCC